MRRYTIDFGIDLGTIKSAIAVAERGKVRLIPNTVGSELTPSAVWIDRRGTIHVGEEAKKRFFFDENEEPNSSLEFKQMMGMDPKQSQKKFARSGRTFLPEELSAEVLKSLRLDVRSNLNEDIQAAVITVPAAFENAATAATSRAAKLAGITINPLLLEPVAASLAYGFQSEKDNVYWLVYDFGGGTFDAAIMRIRDGLIHVENHEGDNALGGKLLDWDIVTERLAPAATAQFNLRDFRRENAKWKTAFGRLKLAAEEAKIAVCRTREPAEVYAEFEDGNGRNVDFSYTLTPADVEAISRPYVVRTLNLCRKTLRDARLEASAMERILMVGGSTLNPWIRDAVQAELRRPLEYGIDPVTVVARGGAIFASTVELNEGAGRAALTPQQSAVWRIETGHKPVGNVSDPDVYGRVLPPPGGSVEGCSIEFFDRVSKWRSGRIILGRDGVFVAQFYANTPGRHDYSIELCDAAGSAMPTEPRSAPYTYMLAVPTAPLLAHTISVELSDGGVAVYGEKGAQLPLRKMLDHSSSIPLRAGRREDVLTIPLLEGEHARARRNFRVGEIIITGADIGADLPKGSPIEITVAIDTSQKIRVSAYFPTLEIDFDLEYRASAERGALDQLIPLAEAEKARLTKTRAEIAKIDLPGASIILAQIDNEDLLDSIRKLANAAAADPGQLRALDRRLREFAGLIDDLEDLLEWPKLVDEAAGERRDAERVVDRNGTDEDKRLLWKLQSDCQRAIDTKNSDELRRITQDFLSLYFEVVDRVPGYHIGRFENSSR